MNNQIISKSDFMDNEAMELFYNELQNMPNDWWSISLYPGNTSNEVCFFRDFDNLSENVEYQQSLEYNVCCFSTNLL
jgi:hypothetical protein